MKKLTALGFCLLLLSCNRQGQAPERYFEGDVEVISNRAKPQKTTRGARSLTLEKEFIIDFGRADLAEVGLSEVQGFDVDSEGNIYLWNTVPRENIIIKLDNRGSLMASFARKGQGPAELENPSDLRINDQNEIIMCDSRKKLVIFNTSGELIKEETIDASLVKATLLENGNILALKETFPASGERYIDLPVVILRHDDGMIEKLQPGQRLQSLVWAKKLDALRLYFNSHVWEISKGQIYISNEELGYEVRVFNFQGKLVRKIKKEYSPLTVPESVKQAVQKFTDEPHRKELQLRDKIYFPPTMPPFQYFIVDDLGRLLVMTFEKGIGFNEFSYDIFTPDGLFVANMFLDNWGNADRFLWGGPFEARAKNDRLYYMRGKESGYKELVVLKTKWN